MLVLECLVGLHRTIQLQLLQCYWLGHRLGLLWYWMVCLGNKQRSFCCFWDCIQVLHFGLIGWHDGYSISSKGFLPTVVDKMVIWVNSPISVYFSLLIPKMLMFTLAISCLITSNLSWLMDLTFQVPMQFLYTIGLCFYHQSHPKLGVVFALAPSLHHLWSYFSTDLQ